MKKLLIITQHYPFGHGEKTFVEPELKVLRDLGLFDITLISNALEGSKQTSQIPKGIRFQWLPAKSILKRPWSSLGYGFWFFLSKEGREERKTISGAHKLLKIFESMFYYVRACIWKQDFIRSGIDVENAIVYTYWFYTQTLGMALLKSKFRSMKLVSRIHGYDLYDERSLHGRQPFRKWMDKRMDRIIFCAEFGLEYYQNAVGQIDRQRYVLHRLGIIPTEQGIENKVENSLEDCFILVSCSNVIAIKRLDLIVRALALVGYNSKRKVRWVHFGDGELLSSLEEQANHFLEKYHNITYDFWGWVENSKIIDFYCRHEIGCFITTSSTEGSPVSVQEALAYGIPIIGTSVGAIPTMIDTNGVLLSDNPSAQEVADAIARMANMSVQGRRQMSNRSKEIWREKFDGVSNFKAFADELVAL